MAVRVPGSGARTCTRDRPLEYRSWPAARRGRGRGSWCGAA